MKITVTTVSLSGSPTRTFTWAVGQPAPEGWHDTYLHDIREVAASGDELQHIARCFVGLPGPGGKFADPQQVIRYFGDHAKFITANLFTTSK